MININTLLVALFPLFVVGVTEFVNALRSKNYKAAETIVIAGVVGLAAGIIRLGGFDPVSGLAAGFTAVGVVTTAQNVKVGK